MLYKAVRQKWIKRNGRRCQIGDKLEAGDTLTYQTAQGERQYQVTEVREIAGDDWSYLSRTDDNRITMITCITGKPDLRLMVQAKEI